MTHTLLTEKTAELDVDAVHESGKITVRLVGTADLRVTDTMATVLSNVHSRARELRASEVVMDVRNLEFMNSSCFKSFVSWIGELQELDASQQYRIRFLSDPSMLWQRRSLHALSCFAADLVSIDGGK